ncbi:hypothetical protein [Pseudonocardia charpentierae]|uniref:Uncharacterized protein n=1 Tax=Pseudonocardia charpentierae TaxID=3075545 RepID=A0ABU2NC62_9PSEU|nr:hypothetical protein [Pseudonocardia sp. DSM 45834]MDT0350618.1 hypothetical protein [Pseudonocardia sp. DSM 45834]
MTRRRLGRDDRPPLRADTLLTATAAGDTRLLSTRERMVLGLVGSGLIALRDIAFLVDRGLFAVTLDVRYLVETRLLEVVPRAAPVAPRAAAPAAPRPVPGGVLPGPRLLLHRRPLPHPARPDRRRRRPRPVLPPQALNLAVRQALPPVHEVLVGMGV